ncbi:MAG: acyltransferase [Bdellovibrionales bacterium]|nr:acyltransferase [Bdellovibrionales bacterium]
MLYRLPPASGLGARLVWFLRGAVSSTVILVALLPVNGVQLVGVLMLPVSRRAYRGINRACAGFWWGICAWWLTRINGMRLVVSGDGLLPGENAIVVCNHQQMSDIPALLCLAASQGRLGDMKWVVKHGLKYVPLIGWGMQMLGCLFVKRAWTEDRETVRATFAAFRDEKLPLWLMTFPEGTRITESKRERSRRFGRRAGLPDLQEVLLPRTRGFVAAVEGLRGHADAVIDLTLGFPGGIPTLWQMFQGRVREVHVYARRTPLSDLPVSAEALDSWLVERFVEKDRLMAGLRREGRFRAPEGPTRHIPAVPDHS